MSFFEHDAQMPIFKEFGPYLFKLPFYVFFHTHVFPSICGDVEC